MSVSIHALSALKTALKAHVQGHNDVKALIGAAFHDMPQKIAHPPFLAFGHALIRDDSSQLSDGVQIDLELVAVAHERGTTRALALLAALENALETPLPPMAEHRLVALERPEARVHHDPDTNLVRATYRLRAYIERI